MCTPGRFDVNVATRLNIVEIEVRLFFNFVRTEISRHILWHAQKKHFIICDSWCGDDLWREGPSPKWHIFWNIVKLVKLNNTEIRQNIYTFHVSIVILIVSNQSHCKLSVKNALSLCHMQARTRVQSLL